MRKNLVLLVLCTILFSGLSQASERPIVVLHTTMGDIKLSLNSEKAPKSVENFLKYVRAGDYDGTIFHRVISSFMIQGGGFTVDLKRKETREPVENEADNRLKNKRGTIAMARTGAPHSATSQFFINVVDNDMLNYKSKDNGRTWGYTVFGEVIDGMDIVDDIRFVETGAKKPFPRNVPLEPVIITKVEVIEK